ncbi:MAG: phosphoenolpyruvate--protein phosphotransferase, partial [Erythrobacter sp.]|nr:phosphoenolpyruvate--protein phosphotransferase [Erythrobacter sp.]
MQKISGIAVSSGIVIGKVFVIEDTQSLRVARRHIEQKDVPVQLERFEKARETSINELNELHKSAAAEMGKEAAKIFLFHIGVLNDPSVLTPIREKIENERVNPAFAISSTFLEIAQKFAAHPDSTFQSKVDDLRDLAHRLLRDLGYSSKQSIAELDEGTVIVARDLTPSQTANFDRDKVTAFVTGLGGPTSHTAIVAGALSLPAVVGASGVMLSARTGQEVIVDGERGLVIFDPNEETLEKYRQEQIEARKVSLSLSEFAELPAITADGVRINVMGNIEFPDEVEHVTKQGGTGVGLYRTEFLYLTGDYAPSEEDHFEAYKRCVQLLEGKPLTIRTIDLGADKYTQAQEEIPERNPFLGLRSIRYSLKNQKMFRTQLRAILRASAMGPVKIMFPLVTNIAELRTGKYYLREEMEELDEQGIAYDPEIEVGMMVEVPAAALMATSFAHEVDFFSIGTNDLVQYTLAVDRTNERVASMYQPIHPAVLKLIRDVSRAGRRSDIPVSCCGQSAADPAFAALLLGLGVRTISATASSLPMLKKTIRSLTVAQCERIAKKAISFDSEAEAS